MGVFLYFREQSTDLSPHCGEGGPGHGHKPENGASAPRARPQRSSGSVCTHTCERSHTCTHTHAHTLHWTRSRGQTPPANGIATTFVQQVRGWRRAGTPLAQGKRSQADARQPCSTRGWCHGTARTPRSCLPPADARTGPGSWDLLSEPDMRAQALGAARGTAPSPLRPAGHPQVSSSPRCWEHRASDSTPSTSRL